MMSLHMKATMMKVSDPIIFGHCVKVFFKDVFAKHATLFAELGINANNGLGDVYEKIKGHAMEAEVVADLAATYAKRPGLAMVDSDNGITNLHVPSDVIIDASMPNVVRDGGKMWNKDDKLEDVLCVIPDRCYADAYGVILEDCRKNGQFDWMTMGPTPTSDSWLKRPRNTDLTTRPLRFQPLAKSSSRTRLLAPPSSNTTSKLATSGACARPK